MPDCANTLSIDTMQRQADGSDNMGKAREFLWNQFKKQECAQLVVSGKTDGRLRRDTYVLMTPAQARWRRIQDSASNSDDDDELPSTHRFTGDFATFYTKTIMRVWPDSRNPVPADEDVSPEDYRLLLLAFSDGTHDRVF
jgi:hypothetical protein